MNYKDSFKKVQSIINFTNGNNIKCEDSYKEA